MAANTQSSRPPLFTSGERVREAYIVEACLGAGAQGEVYRVRDVLLDRPVALKVLSPSARNRLSVDQAALGEARALSRLQHPNVVQVFGFGTHGQHWFVVMEYIAGGTLQQRMRQTSFTEVEALHVIDQIARGLTHAHERGVVHGDVKPANVLVTTLDGDSLHLKVADFGLATHDEGGTAAPDASQGQSAGATGFTPLYAAPEVIAGGRAGPAADTYALGVLAYELLAGRHPFSERSDLSILWAHRNEKPKILEGAYGEALDRALRKDPADRFKTPSEFARALLAGSQGSRAASGETEPARAQRADAQANDDLGATASVFRSTAIAGDESVWVEGAALVADVKLQHASGRELYRGETALVAETFARGAGQQVLALGGTTVSWVGGRLVTLFSRRDGLDGERAVDAGLGLQALARSIEADPTLPVRSVVAVRAAVDVGEMMRPLDWLGAPVVGGGALDVAAADAASAAPSGVVVTPAALRRSAGLFDVRGIGGHRHVTQRRPFGHEFASDRGPWVGRELELALIRRSLSSAAEQRLQHLVTLGAPGGFGKSRIVEELASEAAADGRLSLFSGRCSPEGVGLAHEPFVQAILAPLAREPGALHERIARYLDHLEPEGSPVDHERDGTLIARLAGGNELAADERAGARDAERTATVRALAHLIRLQSRLPFTAAEQAFEQNERPVLLHIDDFQWSRPATRDLVSALMAELEQDPVVWLLAHRPDPGFDVAAVWRGPSERKLSLTLGPLSAGESRQLASALSGGVVPPELGRAIAEGAGGIPLLIEEAVFGGARGIEALDSLLLGRLATLPPDVVAALETMAAAGASGWVPMPGVPDNAVPGLLATGFFAEGRPSRVGGAREFLWRSELKRQVVYRNLDPRVCKAAHRSIAIWLESRAAGLEDLARHHFERGGELASAARCAVRAGRQALGSLAASDAAAVFEDALRLAALSDASPEPVSASVREDAWLGLALAQVLAGSTDEALRTLDRAAETANAAFRARLAARRAGVLEQLGRTDDALLALDVPDAVGAGLIELAARRAMILSRRGRFAEARHVAQQTIRSLQGAPEPASHETLGTLYGALGHAASRLGDRELGEQAYGEAVKHWEATGFAAARATALLALGNATWWRDDLHGAAAHWERALACARKAGFLHGTAVASVNLAEYAVRTKRPEEGLRYAEEGEGALRALGSRDQLAEALRVQAEALLALEHLDRAEARARDALAEATGGAGATSGLAAPALRTLARVQRACQRGDAWATYQMAIDGFAAAGQQLEVERTKQEQSNG